MAEQIGHRFEAVEAQLRIGKAWCLQKQYARAKEFGQQALAQANAIASPTLQYKSHYLLYKTAQAMGEPEEALAHHVQFHESKQTVFNQESDARKAALEAIHHVEQAQKETEIYQLKSVALEREIAERNRIAAELQQQNEELNAFAQTVAHDLKSPLALMTGFAEVLHGNLASLSSQDVSKIADSIFAAGHKAAEIVDELLLLAGVRSQEVMPEPVDMTAVIADAIYQLRAEIETKQARIVQPDTFPFALGYAPWIEQVWKNYISNGLKYGGTPPELTLGFTLKADDLIRFWVRDNGAGLKPDEQARLFTEFTRLDHGKAKGHGLGLAIVRRIVEKLNGRVGVESTPGEGSLFYFDLSGLDDGNG
jgi:signal transduction histidine kinase